MTFALKNLRVKKKIFPAKSMPIVKEILSYSYNYKLHLQLIVTITVIVQVTVEVALTALGRSFDDKLIARINRYLIGFRL